MHNWNYELKSTSENAPCKRSISCNESEVLCGRVQKFPDLSISYSLGVDFSWWQRNDFHIISPWVLGVGWEGGEGVGVGGSGVGVGGCGVGVGGGGGGVRGWGGGGGGGGGIHRSAVRGVISLRSSNVELWCFLCCYPEKAVDQTVVLPVICDGMTLMWRHCVITLNTHQKTKTKQNKQTKPLLIIMGCFCITKTFP